MKRGEVWWADLVPRSGSEQRGRRPVVVVSHDALNTTEAWRSIVIVPVTTSRRQAERSWTVVPLERGEAGLTHPSYAVCHQITTLDRGRFVERIGVLAPTSVDRIDEGLLVALDLPAE